MNRPGTVTAAFVLWIIAAIVGLVSAILAFVAFGAGGAVTGGLTGGVAIAVGVFALIVAIIQVIIVFKMRDGRNWARIVLTILGILSIVSNINSGVQGQGFSWVTLIVTLIAVILMYVGGANAYFRSRR